MSIKSGWLIVLFKSSLSILIFCLIGLTVIEKGVLKWPTIIAGLSISFFISVSFCFMYFKALLLAPKQLVLLHSFNKLSPL